MLKSKPKKIKCARCGKDFDPINWAQKFCGPVCRYAAQKGRIALALREYRERHRERQSA